MLGECSDNKLNELGTKQWRTTEHYIGVNLHITHSW
jgi:hypothetical protein